MESKISSGDHVMKRIILLITVTTVFILSSSAALAAPKEGKGKPDAAGVKAEKGEVKAPKTPEAGQEKVKAGKEKAEKEVRAVKEKETTEAKKPKEKAEKKAEEVKKDKSKGKPEGKGLGKEQKAAAQAKQMQHEDQKHVKRQARLQEMLKVAQEKGDDTAVERIQKLMEKETNRYSKKQTKMTQRAAKEKAGEGTDGDGGADAGESSE
jgi:hypothetical protein